MLDIINHKCKNVTSKKTGIIGPQLLGKNIGFLSEIIKSQKDWLDTTVQLINWEYVGGIKGQRLRY